MLYAQMNFSCFALRSEQEQAPRRMLLASSTKLGSRDEDMPLKHVKPPLASLINSTSDSYRVPLCVNASERPLLNAMEQVSIGTMFLSRGILRPFFFFFLEQTQPATT